MKFQSNRKAVSLVILCLLVAVGPAFGWPWTQETPEEKAEKAADSKRFDMAFWLAKEVRRKARDPDSVVFEQMLVSTDANTACTEYRARNGFGGMARATLIVVGSKQVPVSAANVKKHCTGLHDYLGVARAVS